MTLQVRCTTRFDITVTEVRNNFSRSRLPFHDANGKLINDPTAWNRARNQQRNWETINQVISLRTLPENITTPTVSSGVWVFEFEVPSLQSLGHEEDPVKLLIDDVNGVPMIVNLTETSTLSPYLDDKTNIWFTVIN